MAWQYMAVCLFDFILAPIFLGIYAFYTKTPYIAWVPLSLQGGGLYHLAMGAVVGVTSYAKSQERVSLSNIPLRSYQDPYQGQGQRPYQDPYQDQDAGRQPRQRYPQPPRQITDPETDPER